MWLRWLAWLPLSVLYRLADIISFVVYYIIRYRRQVTYANLTRAFPEKSPREIQKIVRGVYHNIADVLVEAIKAYRINPQEMNRRVNIVNGEVFQPYFDKQQPIIVLATHQANWEWLLLASKLQFGVSLAAIYRPLHNVSYDKFMLAMRSRFGIEMIPARRTFMRLMRNRYAHQIVAAVADQSPVEGDEKCWFRRLNQDTAFPVGMEKVARILQYPVFFAAMQRIKRGYYTIEFKLIAEPPFAADNYPIMNKYSELFEQQIITAPSSWLWTNRRWKYKKPVYE